MGKEHTRIIDPATIAEKYIEEVRREIAALDLHINVLGLIASKDKPSLAYASATQRSFAGVGIDYDLRRVERLDLEQIIHAANDDPDIHGTFIYFPVFHNQQDDYVRNEVDYRKDIEAGSRYWTQKLYKNDRSALDQDSTKKALLPCTPLAIVKILTEVGMYTSAYSRPVENKTVTIFNRSEVIGRPLAMMMSNDGARVYSFDINGPLLFTGAVATETNITRAQALRESDIVITGVPSTDFEKVRADEIEKSTICLNFSSVENFEKDVEQHTSMFIPRVGPMTVAMCMRNSLRLFHHFHE